MTKEDDYKKSKIDPGQFKDLLKDVDPETLDSLKNMALSLMGGDLKPEVPEKEKKEERNTTGEEEITQEIVAKMANVVSALGTAIREDPYVNEERFILAVKPFAGKKGQEFCDQAVKMLKVAGIAQYILENKDSIIKG